MQIRGTTRLLGILGNPVSHSLSPAMHNFALEHMGLDAVYIPLPIESSSLQNGLRSLKDLKFLGVNVTMPHKQAVLPCLDEISELSQLIGAVNTITFHQGKSFGTTTDPQGFLAGFQEAGFSFTGKSVAIFGNGGSARTLVFALLHQASPLKVTLVAREPLKSQALQEEIATKLGQNLAVLAFDEYPQWKSNFEILVHATPTGMAPHIEKSLIPPEWLEPGQIVYDIVYNPEETALLRQARIRGCQTVGGLGMLVHQGLASFQLWTGLNPDPALFYQGIRNAQRTSTSQKPL